MPSASKITELVMVFRGHAKVRRILAYEDQQGGPLCVACAIDRFGNELLCDPAGDQQSTYVPVYAGDRRAVAELRGVTCHGALPLGHHRALARGG